jgi:hypothetical protein
MGYLSLLFQLDSSLSVWNILDDERSGNLTTICTGMNQLWLWNETASILSLVATTRWGLNTIPFGAGSLAVLEMRGTSSEQSKNVEITFT